MKPCRCGHLLSEHAPGSRTCMAVKYLAEPSLMTVCPCDAYAPADPEPIGRWALRMAGVGLEVALAAASIARDTARGWWASWRARKDDP